MGAEAGTVGGVAPHGAAPVAVRRTPHGRLRHHWGWSIALGVVIAVVVVVRLILDPIAAHYTRKELNASDSLRGDFQSVHVTVFPPGYEIHRLKIDERVDPDWKHPLFYAERVKAGLDMRSLVHGRLVAHARFDDPKIIFTEREKTAKKPARPPDLAPALRRMVPARVDQSRGPQRRARVPRPRGQGATGDLGSTGSRPPWRTSPPGGSSRTASRRR